MKDATLFVVGKSHQGDDVIENLLNYMINSIFADCDEMLTNLSHSDSFDSMMYEICQVQEPFNMEHHRVMFHFILSTRPSHISQRILTDGAYAILDYFNMLGHQVIIVPHYGSNHNADNFHYHIAVNPVSATSQKRLLDKYETYNNIRDFLNLNTHSCWSWRYTNTTNYEKYIQ